LHPRPSLRRLDPAVPWNSALPSESHRFPMQPRRFGSVPQPFGPLFVAALAAAALLHGGAAHAAAVRTDHVTAELVAERRAVGAGQTIRIGLKLQHIPHWHTYWRNPGDSGEPTTVTWKLPEGFSASGLEWPAPSLIKVGPVTSFGYEGETVLLARITPPRDLKPDSNVTLSADVAFLVCEKECIPGEASVSLALPVAVSGGGGGPNVKVFDRARSQLPQPSPWTATFDATAKTLSLALANADLRRDNVRSATFFPYDNTLIVNSAPQTLSAAGAATQIAIERGQIARSVPQRFDGVLVVEEDIGGKPVRHAFAIDAAPAPIAGQGISLLQAALLALVAGVILNLMPCVFPVLSIKILHLTQHASEPPARIRLHGLAYTAGILASFAVLAGGLYALRAGGAEIGWGFQLQSPAVVATLAFILFAFGLSLSGVLPIGTSLTRVGGSHLLQRTGLSGSFFAGMLATVVATPCTAPFMGASIGYALTQPFLTGLAVFLALGLGLALPFLVLAFVPGLQGLLPRPGRWMETLKQFLAFPLYGTAAWLIWVLSFQVGPAGLMAALAALVLIAFAAWAYGLAQGGQGVSAGLFRGMAAAAAIAVVAIAVTIRSDQPAEATARRVPAEAGYEAFTQAKLDTLLAAGRPVFVNMTAAWCITCLVNERTALSTEAVREALSGKNVAYLKGDWTNRNPEITRLLERFGRSGVPLYVLYRGGLDPVVLPQILTQSLVLEKLAQL
jgi:thiol:disulfide interchange protein/DsbC/DsbD-like thiol-disulfide interchange protein